MNTESVFISILNELKHYAEQVPKSKVKKNNFNPDYKKANNSSYNQFENLVSWSLQKLNEKHSDWKSRGIKYHLNFGHYFPDINIDIKDRHYGLELKSRKTHGWTINGGSVFESISSIKYSDIYVFFGDTSTKLSHYIIKYMPYWRAIDTIRVTHSPRYHLSMSPKHHIFHSWNDYEKFRKLNKPSKALKVQKELRRLANGPQWYIGNNSNMSPIPLSNLSKKRRHQIAAELMILYPQDLLKPQSNYWHLTEYLLSEYYIYSPDIRDTFSAGGKVTINGIKFSQIIKKMRNNKDIIIDVIKSQSNAFYKKAHSLWPKGSFTLTPLNPNNFLNQYKEVLDYLGNKFMSNELHKAHINKLSSIIF